MTPARAEALLRGQSSTARKLFEVVPVMEAWAVDDIRAELMRSGKVGTIERHATLACLRDLVDAGLIGEPTREWFRSRVRMPKEPQKPRPVAAPAITYSEPVMQAATTAAPEKKTNTLDTLADLASGLGGVVNDLRNSIIGVQQIAKQLEDVAMAIETERQVDARQLAKLGQLQALLRDITPTT